jgi:hypothetical protein
VDLDSLAHCAKPPASRSTAIGRSTHGRCRCSKVALLSVNEAERDRQPCGRLVFKRGQVWTLLAHGQDLLDLLTY